MKRNKKQQGFSLIELMIVVAIIGVLSAIAIPAYQNYVKKSEASVGLSTARSLLTNIDMKIQETGAFPTTLAAVGATAGMNKLGTLSLTGTDATGSVEFTFGTASSINGKKVTITKSTTGWSCSHDTGEDLKGC
ncbi:prepilin-type cleavage/methylation domain-containing protein [Vibrio albus]|uniref:Prepilin-type cleavage/methylation domain-containing protein n=1 Tax=Vibrio albus TaxID=2200953 RepID=A0A2U3BCQ3_9VIBR|nr:pilin [Vibrio albus]PWI34567.1 prepilin-type cleavage/methylation domain-containing protein [Vibrio albus]